MRISAIVLAAGAGRRFRSTAGKRFKLLKAFYPLKSRPMFLYSLDILSASKEICEIILAVPSQWVGRIRRRFLGKKYSPKVSAVVRGGKARTDSCQSAFKRLDPKSTHVLIHDAARPLLSSKALAKLVSVAKKYDGAILGKRVVPTIKQTDRSRSIKLTVSRENMWEAETPQIFKRGLLEKAFAQYKKNPAPILDDAALCEPLGAKIKIVENPTPNVKITTFSDLRLAEKILANGASERWGIGFDVHRLVPNRKFMLGGVRITGKFGALGHSDGDALLHAVTDALLGAAGLGDIGDWFPDTNKRYRGVPSSIFLKRALRSVKELGLAPVHLDTIVHLERPKLKQFKEKIRSRLASLLSMRKSQVNIKAKTHEGLGSIGKAKAVAAEAVITLGMENG
ncbi:MAG: 2-C-methyl-D-erythritol 2,4-cyclodiphosphate synthase [Candidatus Omnitrophica bacterium]|nr:2-C-methyl-D-erythritol 2,4-cyclodiphosphate synthase [Candidatus Omnitrophota bacterium]